MHSKDQKRFIRTIAQPHAARNKFTHKLKCQNPLNAKSQQQYYSYLQQLRPHYQDADTQQRPWFLSSVYTMILQSISLLKQTCLKNRWYEQARQVRPDPIEQMLGQESINLWKIDSLMPQLFMDGPVDSPRNSQLLESNVLSALKEPALQIDYSMSMDIHPHLPPINEVKSITMKVIERVRELKSEVKQNERLEKYFKIAEASAAEIYASLTSIEGSLQEVLEALDKRGVNLPLLVEFILFMQKIQRSFHPKKLSNIDKAIWILEFETNISFSTKPLLRSFFVPLDITTLPKDKYEDVWSQVKTETVGDNKKISEALLSLKKTLTAAVCAIMNEQSCSNAVSKLLSFGLSFPKYMISNKEGQLKSIIFQRKMTVEMARLLSNLPESGFLREMGKISLVSIKTNIKIYVPFKEGTVPKQITEDDGQSIQVRILHSDTIHFKKKKGGNKSFGCMRSTQIRQPPEHEAVILHIHGGSFFALSSHSTQIHTRRWANALKIPIFSVDYRMPPQHVFPTAPEDCLRVYEFLINHAHKFMNVKPKRVILAGDSAGGNIAFALMALILKHNLPPPIGIYTAYPALDLRFQLSPSKLYAFIDPLVSPSMMMLCQMEYLKGKLHEHTNPLATPLLLTEQFVGGKVGDKRFPLKWPKTVLHVGQKDPMFDCSIMMMEKMVRSGVEAHCHIYENLTHGFLSLDSMIPDLKKTVEDSILHLGGLLKGKTMIKM